MMQYEKEGLLSLVAKLVERYTSKDSTSVTYEVARQLMEAVMYCINEYESDDQVTQLYSKDSISAQMAYQLGYDKVVQKVIKAQQQYNDMILYFNAYGNENYWDTVTKALPGFFRYYDIDFAPQNTIITMDYPVLGYNLEGEGIDIIDQYIKYISLEQRFLSQFQEDYVRSILSIYQPDYAKMFYNICFILLRHVLGCMLTGKRMYQAATEEDYQQLQFIVADCGKDKLEEKLAELLHEFIVQQFDGNEEMRQYFTLDIKDFTVELKNASEYNRLKCVVVL